MRSDARPASARRLSRAVIVLLGLLSMAPTAGDVGGCGTEVTALDPTAFANARKEVDCSRCKACSIHTERCTSACDPKQPSETSIPKTCQPLSHDGEVCLRKLQASSCDAYTAYVADVGPSTPSECEFCKIAPAAAPTGTFGVDSGTADGGR